MHDRSASFPNELTCDASQELLPAHALGALDREEQSQVEQHLVWCATCRRELLTWEDTVNLLPLLAPQVDPPDDVKPRLMAAINADDREPSLSRSWTSPAAPEAAQSHSVPFIPSRWAAALIMPLAICILVLGAWVNSLRHDVIDLRTGMPADVTSAMTQNGVQLYAFSSETNGATGQMGADPNGNTGVMVVWNLNPEERHQVWCVNRQGVRSMIAELEVGDSGQAMQVIVFPASVEDYQQIYVAKHDGTQNPPAEMTIAMDDSPPDEAVPTEPIKGTPEH